MENIKCVVEEGCYIPEKAHDTDAGFDLRTPKEFILRPYGTEIVRLGVHVAIPKGYAGMVKSKSGLYVKRDIIVTGVVDTGFTGSIVVKVTNLKGTRYKFEKGDKIAQLVITEIHPCSKMEVVDHLEETERGDSGFGSTGR